MSNEGANSARNVQSQLRQRSNRDSDESKERPDSKSSPAPNELRLVLLGKTGAGKRATGNTILGNRCFDDGLSMSSVTKECKRECATVEERELVLVDTPDFFNTDQTLQKLERCLALSSPGPHAFLLVVPISERFTKEQQDTVDMILRMFHEDVAHHTILIFSHADRLGGESIEEFISKQNQKVQELVERFGRRFVAFDNTTNRDQVSRLLREVDELLDMNENRHFICQISEDTRRIIEERRQADMAERKRKIKQDVRKMADDRWRLFIASMNEERQDIERKMKRIQDRIDQIETDRNKEEQNAHPIPERLERFETSLKREQDNMRRLEEREIKKRMKREEIEKKDLEIWKKEEEQRRLNEEGQNNERSSDHCEKILRILLVFFLGLVVGFVLALSAFKFFDFQVKSAESSTEDHQQSSWNAKICR